MWLRPDRGGMQAKKFRGGFFQFLSNTFSNLEKYHFNFEQIHLNIWTSIMWPRPESVVMQSPTFRSSFFQLGQMLLAIWTNTFSNLNKYISKFGQI